MHPVPPAAAPIDTTAATTTTLDRSPLGEAVIVHLVEGPPPVVRRLAELGIRRAAVVTPMHRTAGGGRVIDIAGGRIALARTVLDQIRVEARP